MPAGPARRRRRESGAAWLEDPAYSELHLARWCPGPRNAAGRRVGLAVDERDHVRRAEVRAVEQIERLEPELKPAGVRLEVLEHRQVDRGKTRRPHRAAGKIAEEP